MSGIFICYRRVDSQGFAGRLSDDLAEQLGENNVFRDDEIIAGSDYTEVLKSSVRSCSVLLVVIGKQWITVENDDGSKRLDNPEDWVRLEIESGLKSNMLVVPVLVGDATMPGESELPLSMTELCRRQAFVMSDRYWEPNLESLIELLSTHDERLRPAAAVKAPALSRKLPDLRSYQRPRSRGRFLRWIKKFVWYGFLALVGYFVLENYVEPDMRKAIYKFVNEFIVFALDFGESLWKRASEFLESVTNASIGSET